MLTFHPTMGQHAMEVRRNDAVIGSIQWHSHRSPCFINWLEYMPSLSLIEMKQLVKQLEECINKGG